jgi:hypothetical protein
MAWFWLNMPFAAIFWLAYTLIPMWMVIKHPDTGEEIAETAERAEVVPLHVLSRREAMHWREAEAAA